MPETTKATKTAKTKKKKKTPAPVAKGKGKGKALVKKAPATSAPLKGRKKAPCLTKRRGAVLLPGIKPVTYMSKAQIKEMLTKHTSMLFAWDGVKDNLPSFLKLLAMDNTLLEAARAYITAAL